MSIHTVQIHTQYKVNLKLSVSWCHKSVFWLKESPTMQHDFELWI